MSMIQSCDVRGVMVLDVSGRLTILDHSLRKTVTHYLKSGYRHFNIQMSNVSYIDSCGLGELVTVYTSIRNSGGTVRFVRPSEKVRKLLSTTKLDTVFDITEDDITPFDKNGMVVRTDVVAGNSPMM